MFIEKGRDFRSLPLLLYVEIVYFGFFYATEPLACAAAVAFLAMV